MLILFGLNRTKMELKQSRNLLPLLLAERLNRTKMELKRPGTTAGLTNGTVLIEPRWN